MGIGRGILPLPGSRVKQNVESHAGRAALAVRRARGEVQQPHHRRRTEAHHADVEDRQLAGGDMPIVSACGSDFLGGYSCWCVMRADADCAGSRVGVSIQ